MTYEVFILRRAQKQLGKIPTKAYELLKEEIFNLASDPRPLGSKKLIGREGWRIRVGQYRIIYEVDDSKRSVTVLDIGHRKEIYL